MSDLSIAFIGGIAGAVAGSITGAFFGWLIAPTQSEREERGRQRVDGRRQIGAVLASMSHALIEARGKMFRMDPVDDLLDRSRFIGFASSIITGANHLPRLERFRLRRKARTIVGPLIWRLAEILPPERFDDIDEGTLLKATADTRDQGNEALCGTALARVKPIDARWDAALKAISKMQKSYPS